MDDPILHTQARRLTPDEVNTKEVQELIDHLFEVMRVTGAVGVAANQIGVNLSVAVYKYAYRDELPDIPEIKENVIINPIVAPFSDIMDDVSEGCLSVPNVRGIVSRNRDIMCSFLDRNGNKQQKVFHNLEARIIQHETDHLNGILFISKLKE